MLNTTHFISQHQQQTFIRLHSKDLHYPRSKAIQLYSNSFVFFCVKFSPFSPDSMNGFVHVKWPLTTWNKLYHISRKFSLRATQQQQHLISSTCINLNDDIFSATKKWILSIVFYKRKCVLIRKRKKCDFRFYDAHNTELLPLNVHSPMMYLCMNKRN